MLVGGLFVAALFFPIYARGDWMSEGRFAVAAWPPLTVLAVNGCERLSALAARRLAPPWNGPGLLGLPPLHGKQWRARAHHAPLS
jgi:hypothetical protein